MRVHEKIKFPILDIEALGPQDEKLQVYLYIPIFYSATVRNGSASRP
jgi:hypothetical protein